MVVEARFRVMHRGCFTAHLPAGAHVTKIGGDRHGGVSIIQARSPDAVDAILRDMDALTGETSVVERAENNVIVRCAFRSDGIIATIIGLGCTIMWPAVYVGGFEHYTIIAPTRERVLALVDRLSDMGDVHLERISEVGADVLDVSVSLSDVTSGLTERQLLVLQRAIESGYYDSPRRVSADALAAAFGVSRSTFQEHLRKAEERVLRSFASVLGSHPALLKGATKRSGRPRRRTPVTQREP